MGLQSKKSTQPLFCPSIIAVFILSLAYWSYLALTTHMEIVFDSVGYEALGRLICTKGWVAYFTTGPNREPLYPLLIAASMDIGQFLGIAYAKVMAFFGVIILFVTQFLSYKILRQLKVRQAVCILMLAYLAVSPALNNAAFSLYSEIAAFPIILGIILAGTGAWEAAAQNKPGKALGLGALLGTLLALAIFVKAVFECIAPVYLAVFFIAHFLTNKKIIPLALCLIAAAAFYVAPVTGYKWFNQHYNGNFAVTNRASWALYGNTVRRMEPLTLKRFAEALAFAPGEGVCDSLFGAKECDFWSYRKSDELGYAKASESSSILLKLSAQKALQNPLQYALLTIVEALKMFFWESTKIGFVDYPSWLQKIYNIKLFDNAIRFFAALASVVAIVGLWARALKPERSPTGFLMGLLILLYILFFSFFFILTRYALPIAPLYLISIGLWLEKIIPKHYFSTL